MAGWSVGAREGRGGREEGRRTGTPNASLKSKSRAGREGKALPTDLSSRGMDSDMMGAMRVLGRLLLTRSCFAVSPLLALVRPPKPTPFEGTPSSYSFSISINNSSIHQQRFTLPATFVRFRVSTRLELNSSGRLPSPVRSPICSQQTLRRPSWRAVDLLTAWS